jgi:hypothetical protein
MLFTKYCGLYIIEWIVIIILTIILIYYIIIQKTAPNLQQYIDTHKLSLNWISYNDLLTNADNGDLLFMAGDTYGERTCRYFTKSVYSHVGMLFREIDPENDKSMLYIWESDLGQGSKDGPRILKLSDKLKRYHGFPYVMWRRMESNRPSTQNIMNVVEKYKDYNFDNNMLSWMMNDSMIYNMIKNDGIFCSELIALTMQHINMLEKDKKATWYSPQSFVEGISGLKKDFFYGPKYYIEIEKHL